MIIIGNPKIVMQELNQQKEVKVLNQTMHLNCFLKTRLMLFILQSTWAYGTFVLKADI